MPFQPPEPVGDYQRHQERRESHEVEDALLGTAIAAAIVALGPAARRAAIRFRAMTGKQKAIVILGAVAIFTALLFA